jgi:hypothetical protein
VCIAVSPAQCVCNSAVAVASAGDSTKTEVLPESSGHLGRRSVDSNGLWPWMGGPRHRTQSFLQWYATAPGSFAADQAYCSTPGLPCRRQVIARSHTHATCGQYTKRVQPHTMHRGPLKMTSLILQIARGADQTGHTFARSAVQTQRLIVCMPPVQACWTSCIPRCVPLRPTAAKLNNDRAAT